MKMRSKCSKELSVIKYLNNTSVTLKRKHHDFDLSGSKGRNKKSKLGSVIQLSPKLSESLKLLMKKPNDKILKELKFKGLNNYIINYSVYKDPFKPRIGPNALFFLNTCFKEKIAAERTRIANEKALQSQLMKFKLEPEEEQISYLDKIRDRIMERNKRMSKVLSSTDLKTLPHILDHTIETTNDNVHNSYYDFEMDLSKNEISKIMNPEGENTQQDEKEIYKEFFDSQENSKDMFDKSIKFSKEEGNMFVKKVRFSKDLCTLELDRLTRIKEFRKSRYDTKKDSEYQKYKHYFNRFEHQHNATRIDQQKQTGFNKINKKMIKMIKSCDKIYTTQKDMTSAFEKEHFDKIIKEHEKLKQNLLEKTFLRDFK